MELHEALDQIAVIRRTLASSQVFRGYGARPMAVCSAMACGGSALQATFIPRPLDDFGSFLTLWIFVAALGLTVSLADVWWRYRHSPLSLWREDAWLALTQFLPCLGAGALATLAVVRVLPEARALLPGLWSMFFGLGLFASIGMLPHGMSAVAAWYVTAGGVAIALFSRDAALSPWSMVVTFGVGQAGAAVAHYYQPATSSGCNDAQPATEHDDE